MSDLRQALQDLYDAQPSESPIWNAHEWEDAMDAARQALEETERKSVFIEIIDATDSPGTYGTVTIGGKTYPVKRSDKEF